MEDWLKCQLSPLVKYRHLFTEKSMLAAGDKAKVLLDMCTIRAEPVLDFYVEHLELPEHVIKQFNMKLEGIETAAGLVILSKL